MCIFYYLHAFSGIKCCSPTAEDKHEPVASCSPPQWGGGELRGSNESHFLNYFFIRYLLSAQKVTQKPPR